MADFIPTAPREPGEGIGSTYMVEGDCRQCGNHTMIFRSGRRCEACVNRRSRYNPGVMQQPREDRRRRWAK